MVFQCNVPHGLMHFPYLLVEFGMVFSRWRRRTVCILLVIQNANQNQHNERQTGKRQTKIQMAYANIFNDNFAI